MKVANEPKGNLILDPAKIIFSLLREDIINYRRKKSIALLWIGLAIILAVFDIINEAIMVSPFALVIILIALARYSSIEFKKRITRLGVVYLPISLYKIQNKTILVDRSGTLPTSVLRYPFLPHEDIAKAQKIYDKLKELTEKIPLILNHEKTKDLSVSDGRVFTKKLKLFGEEIDYLDYLEQLRTIFINAKSNEVELPFFNNRINIINSLRAINHSKNGGITIEKYSADFIKNEILKIQGIISERKGNVLPDAKVDIDKIVPQVIKFLNHSAPRYDWAMSYSIRNVETKNIFRFINTFSFSSFNFYCPECNKERLKEFFYNDSQFDGKTKESPVNFPATTKLVLYDINKGLWSCPLCKNITDKPLPVHRLDDELFKHVYDKLYEENKNNRLKIYNDIMNQKRQYSEKAETQFHTMLRENRSKQEQIKSKIRTIAAETNADTSIVKSLYLMMQKYDRISQQRINEFEREILEIKESIVRENEMALRELNEVIKTAQQEISQSLEGYAQLEHVEQAARDEVQKKQLSSLEKMHQIEAARGEREKLFERSNWNPFNWGYNLKRGVTKTVDGITGMDEATTAKHLHQS